MFDHEQQALNIVRLNSSAEDFLQAISPIAVKIEGNFHIAVGRTYPQAKQMCLAHKVRIFLLDQIGAHAVESHRPELYKRLELEVGRHIKQGFLDNKVRRPETLLA